MIKCKGIKQKTMWAYFAPDGYLQFRSIAYTKSDSRILICEREYDNKNEKITYKDYDRKGYVLCKILVDIKIF